MSLADLDYVAKLERQLAETQKLLEALLKHAGVMSQCGGLNCRADIWWIRHLDTGKNVPYNLDGTNHFSTCINRDQFKRAKNDRPIISQ